MRTSATTRWAGPAVIAVTVVVAAFVGRDLWFFSDEWNIIAWYTSGNLLEPFNSHLSLVPVALYQAIFHTLGLDSYVPFRVVGLLAYAVLGGVVWRYSRARVGDAAGAIAVAAVLWGSGGEATIMFPFLLNFSLPMAALVAVWWHFDAESRPGDAWASAWLALALATSGLGLMVVVAIGVEMLWDGRRFERRWWERAAILAPGPILWAAWYLAYGESSPGSGGPREIASYSARMLFGGFTALGAGNRVAGALLAVGFGALVVAAAVRWRAVDGRVMASLVAPAAFCVVTAVSRIGVSPAIPPDENRYRWTVGAFLVLATVNLLRDRVPPVRTTAVNLGYVVAAALVVAGATVLLDEMREWNSTVEDAAAGIRDNLWAAEQADRAGVLRRDRNLPLSIIQVNAGEYVDAAAALGSPLAPFGRDDFGGSDDSRRRADELLVEDFGIELAVSEVDAPPDCRRRTWGAGRSHDSQGGFVAIWAPPDAPVLVGAGVFGRTELPAVGEVPAGGSGVLPLPDVTGRDLGLGYRVTVSTAAEVALCPALRDR